MTNSLPSLDRSKWQSASEAVVEHHFDNHAFCGDFCKRKDLSDKEKQEMGKFFRCESRDEDDLCSFPTTLVGQCATDAKLNEVGHGMDTNANESLNSVVTWMAPKAKTCGGSVSSQTCIFMAIGIHLLAGFEAFFSGPLKEMDTTVTPGVSHCPSMKNRQSRKSNNAKLAKTKRRLRKGQCDQLKVATDQLREARRKELGIHKCGVAPIPTDTVKVCSACWASALHQQVMLEMGSPSQEDCRVGSAGVFMSK